MRLRTLLSAATLALCSAAVWAQAAAPAASPATPVVDQRQARQEKRIDQGQASGALTPRETRRLEREQKVIGKAETQAKADGTVTPRERRQLHHMQDAASKDIHRQKHDRQQRMPPSGPGTGANASPGG
jgi:hypothetical protein